MSFRYIALGDSYTIGTSVVPADSWPRQLVATLEAREPTPDARDPNLDAQGPALNLIANLAVNGYTSRDVIDLELPRLDGLRPEFVSLLVGVNDVLQGVSPDTYQQNVGTILDDLVTWVGPARVLILTTPDYTVTPAGADYGDPVRQSSAIRHANEIISSLATARGIMVVDIFDLSLRAAGDRSLVASDGLHPSGTQYALWVKRITWKFEDRGRRVAAGDVTLKRQSWSCESRGPRSLGRRCP